MHTDVMDGSDTKPGKYFVMYREKRINEASTTKHKLQVRARTAGGPLRCGLLTWTMLWLLSVREAGAALAAALRIRVYSALNSRARYASSASSLHAPFLSFFTTS